VLPSEWATFDVADIGWTKLKRTQIDSYRNFEINTYNLNTGGWRGQSESEETTSVLPFDDLAKGLASGGISRRRALNPSAYLCE
jgi:hypothetical protein